MVMRKITFIVVLISFLLAGCAGVPVREAVKVALNLPVGKIEGNQFTGIRFPFKVSAPPHWKIATEFPNFMLDLGYEKPGLEESEVFVFNPTTQSNIQIDLTPAGRYSKFSQESIEWLTTAATGSFKQELEEEHGKGIEVTVGPTEPINLKGVQFAAKKYATYTVKGVKREQGWIYGFTEPYQLFILFVILEREGGRDREDFQKILSSFEVIPKK
ncbi:MAG: hypothetical protein QME90_06805 [Thermodesulfobacteriota bacterium]|nr:hypothetical protein [Thermodesulfobacteriota bacterium]